ncbi:MAG: ABC transporter permease [Jatrophihabitantaceae bacterium]
MTAVQTEHVQEQRQIIRRVPVSRVPLSRVIQVELRKMFDTRSGFWLMASIMITALLATGAVILFAPDSELTYGTFGAAIGFPMAVILPMVAILSVTSEWSQRSGLTTFTLVPHRSRVVQAKAIASVVVAVVSMMLAFAIGALGNLVGTTITGTSLVWDMSLVDCLCIVLANVLGLLTGFMLGVLIRSSSGAIVAYFVYSFVLTGLLTVLAASQHWFESLRPWVDVNYAQGALFNGSPTAAEWAHIGVTGLVWLVIPLVIGIRYVMRSEVK